MKAAPKKKQQQLHAERIDAFLNSTCQSFRKITQRRHDDEVTSRITVNPQPERRPRPVLSARAADHR